MPQGNTLATQPKQHPERDFNSERLAQVLGDSLRERGLLAPGTFDASSNDQLKTILDAYLENQQVLGSDIANKLHRLEQIQGTPQTSLGAGDVRIGTVLLKVPPERVQINEERNVVNLQGIRTEQNTIVKSGHAVMDIHMDLVFEDTTAINAQLRHIIGQFRATPFTTVESRYLHSVLTDPATTKQPENTKAILNDHDYSKTQFKKINDKIKTFIQKVPENLKHRNFAQAAKDALINILDNGTVDQIHNEIFLSPPWVHDARLNLQFALVFGWDRWRFIRERFLDSIEALNDIVPAADVGPQALPVALSSLQIFTDPENKRLLRARLHMIYFNSRAYTPEFKFKDRFGRGTFDITKAFYYQEFYQNTYTREVGVAPQLRNVDGLTVKQIEARFATRYLGKVRNRISDVGGVPTYLLVPTSVKKHNRLGSETVRYEQFTLDDTTAQGNTRKDTMVSSVSVTLVNNLSFQTHQLSRYPTVQYLGAKVGSFTIEMLTQDEKVLKEITRAKQYIDVINHDPLGRRNRNDRIFISNEIVNLMGIFGCQLENVTTTPVDAVTTAITFEFQDYAFNPSYHGRHRSSVKQRDDERLRKFLRDQIQKSNRPASEATRSSFKAWIALFHPSTGILGVDNLASYIKSPLGNLKSLSKTLTDVIKNEDFQVSKQGKRARHRPERRDQAFLSIRRAINRYMAEVINPFFPLLNGTKTGARIRLRIEELFPSPLVREHETDTLVQDIIAVKAYIGITGQTVSQPTFVAKNAAKEVKLRERQLQFIRDLVDDQVHEYFLKTIARTPNDRFLRGYLAYLKQQRPGEMGRLRRLAQGLEDSTLPKSQENIVYLKTRDLGARETFPDSNYPDIPLPSYQTVFGDIIQFLVGEAFDRKLVSKPINLDPSTDINEIASSPQIVSILERFIPTYYTLGQKAPHGKLPGAFARNLGDPVDPDFYFFTPKAKQLVEAEFVSARESAKDFYTEPVIVPESQLQQQLAERNRQAQRVLSLRDSAYSGNNRGVSRSGVPIPSTIHGLAERRIRRQAQNPGYSTLSLRGTETVESASINASRPEQGNRELTHSEKLEHQRNINTDLFLQQPDDGFRMLKAFPTFDVTFILEGEKQGQRFFSRFSLPGAVASIKIYRHKRELEVATIEFINKAGDLDNTKFKTDFERPMSGDIVKDPPERGHADSVSIRDTFGKEIQADDLFYARHIFKEGTRVVVKMGYGAMLEDLDTVFTGYIADIMKGDVLTIVAQSFFVNLTEPLDGMTEGDNEASLLRATVAKVLEACPTRFLGKYRTKGRRSFTETESGIPIGGLEYNLLFRNRGLISQSDDWKALTAKFFAGLPVDVASRIKTLFTVNHGSFGPHEIAAALSDDSIIQEAGTNVFGFFEDWFDSTPIGEMMNIYLPDSTYWSDLFSSSNDVYFYDRPAFQVIDEMVRRLPGYIWYLMPFEDEARLFIGRPEQLFIARAYMPGGATDREIRDSTKAAARKLRVDFKPLWNDFLDSGLFELLREAVLENYKLQDTSVFEDNIKFIRLKGAAAIDLLYSIEKAVWNWMGGHMTGEPAALKYWRRAYKKRGSLVEREGSIRPAASAVKYIREAIGEGGLKAFTQLWWNGIGVATGYNRSHFMQGAPSFDLPSPDLFGRDLKNLDLNFNKVVDDDTLLGIALTALNNWPRYVFHDFVIGRGPRRSLKVDQLMAIIFGINTDANILDPNFIDGGNSSNVTHNNLLIENDDFEEIAEQFIRFIPSWSLAIRRFAMFLASADSEILGKIKLASVSYHSMDIHPRQEVFRQNFSVNSAADIIRNNIRVSQANMANAVVVRYSSHVHGRPNKHESLALEVAPEEQRTRVVVEPNQMDEDVAQLTVNSHLAEGLRGMYTGELIVRGKSRLKPHDIVYVYDTYNNIYGPVEVEGLFQEMSFQTGFQTRILPCCYTVAYNHSDWYSHNLWSKVFTVASIAAGAFIGGGTGAAVGLAVGNAIGERIARRKGTESIQGVFPPIYSNLKMASGEEVGGIGNSSNVQIFPLTRDNIWVTDKKGNVKAVGGIPWVAGLKGSDKNSFWTDIGQTVQYMGEGIGDWLDETVSDLTAHGRLRREMEQE